MPPPINCAQNMVNASKGALSQTEAKAFLAELDNQRKAFTAAAPDHNLSYIIGHLQNIAQEKIKSETLEDLKGAYQAGFAKTAPKKLDNQRKAFKAAAPDHNLSDIIGHLQNIAQEKIKSETLADLKGAYQSRFAKIASEKLLAASRSFDANEPMRGLLDAMNKFGMARHDARNQYLTEMQSELEKAGVFDSFMHRVNERDWHTELSHLNDPNGTPGITRNKGALKTAQALKTVSDKQLDWLNRNGAVIQRLPGYTTTREYDPNKVRSEGFDGFKDFMLKKLDHNKTFPRLNSAEKIDYLKNTYNGLVSGIHDNDVEPLKNGDEFRAPSNMASKLGAHRSLHFADPSAEYDVMRKYSPDGVTNLFVRNLERHAEKGAAIEKFGPNPENVLTNAYQTFAKEKWDRFSHGDENFDRSDKGFTDKLVGSNNASAFKYRLAEILGQTTGVTARGNVSLLKQGIEMMKALTNLGSLGMTAVSGLGDVANAGHVAYQAGLPWLDSLLRSSGGYLHAFVGGNKDNLEAVAKMTGIAGESIVHRLQPSKLLMAELTNKGLQGFQNKFFTMTGIVRHDANVKMVNADLLTGLFGAHADRTWRDLPPTTRAYLGKYDIDQKFWDVWRTQKQTVSGVDRLGRDMPNLTDAQKMQFLGKRPPTENNFARVQDELERKAGSLFVDAADHTVPRMGISERANLYRGTPASEGWGYVARMVAQLKTFGVTQVSKSLHLAWNGGRGSIAGMAYLTGTSMLWGFAALEAKALMSGQYVNPTDKPLKTILRSLTSGGGLGMLGDVMLPDSPDSKTSFSKMTDGPVLGNIADLYSAYSDVEKGKYKSAANTGLQSAFHLLPFNNFWATKWLFNYYVKNSILDMVNPGHTERVKKIMREEQGQHYLLPQSAFAGDKGEINQ